MGTFTNMFGAAAINEKPADKKSKPQQDFPTCKYCGGALISVRKDFDPTTRTSTYCVSCQACGKTQ